MQPAVSYPGVYVTEPPSGVRTITGVATSIAAFVGSTERGIDNVARRVFGFPDFARAFGGLSSDSELSYAIYQFFENGGTEAYVVRVPRNGAKSASLTIRSAPTGGADSLVVAALSSGAWGNDVRVDVDYDRIDASDDKGFNLTLTHPSSGASERFTGLTMDPTKSNFVNAILGDPDSGSRIAKVEIVAGATKRPAATGVNGKAIKLNADNLPDFKESKAYAVKISSDLPKDVIKDVVVTVWNKQPPPDSVAALCRHLARQINAALPGGATVTCTQTTDADGKPAIRVVASVPDFPDARLSFESGAVGATEDAEAVLQLKAGSENVAQYWLGTGRPASTGPIGAHELATEGSGPPTGDDLIGDEANFSGIHALRKVDLFNILCIPDATRASAGNPAVQDPSVLPNAIYPVAAKLCADRRAFLIIDPPPDVTGIDKAIDWKSMKLAVQSKNAAAYFPRLKLPDPLDDYKLRTFAPCGVIAGLFARTDATRGVWKAPAGIEATLVGVQGLAYKMSDPENGALNPLGLNCLRVFPVFGPVCWGARTLDGADEKASEWKYVPVRRLALYIEESLFRGSKWVVFEPNDEPLWAQIRLNVGAFMQTLFRQGAFQGKTPREAYFVKCDHETTTQDDINRGVVNIMVGFAPLKPAEFVVIHLQQMAGQIQT